MAERIKLIELDFDIDKLKKNMSIINRDVEILTEKQKLLKKSSIDLGIEIQKKTALMQKAEDENKTNTASYVKLKQEIEKLRKVKKLSNEERKQQLIETKSALKAKRKEERLGMQMVEAHTQKEQKNITIARQTKGSIDQISAALAQNRALYRSLTPEQRENSKIGKELLKVIEQQDAEYKKLNKQMGVNQVEVGNYKEEMKKAINESFNLQNAATSLLGPLGSFAPLVMVNVKALKAYALGNKLVRGATNGTSKALKLFRLALISTGVGAIVVLIGTLVTAFMGVKSAMGRSNKTANKVKRIFAGITGIFNAIMKAVEPLGKYLINGLADGFETVGKIADKTMKLLSKGLSFIGWESGAKSVDKFNNSIKQGVKEAQDLTDAQNKLEEAERNAEKTKLDYQKSAEKFRQIRDDENLSINERIKANESLGNVLKEQLNEELKIAQLALKTANLRIQSEGKTQDALDQQAEAMTRISDIQERITGQESEQLTNRVSLQKEAIANAQKRIDAELKASKTRIDIYIAENKDKARTLDGLMKYEEVVFGKKLDLLKDELKHKKKTQEEYELELLNLKRDFSQRQAEIVSEHASKELDIYIAKNKSQIDREVALTSDLVKAEEDRLQTIYDKKVAILDQQKGYLEEHNLWDLEKQQEYTLQKLQLQEEHLTAVNEVKNNFKQQEKEQEQIDYENEKETKQIQAEDELLSLVEQSEAKHQIKLDELERKRLAEVENAKKTGADVSKIDAKYKALSKKAEQEHSKEVKELKMKEFEFKMNIASQTFGNLVTLLGKESEAGRAAAIAQATIDTYKAATSAYSAMAGIPVVGPALGAVAAAAAVASGLKTVQQITSTKKPDIPKAEHGAVFPIGGNRHSAGGTKFYGEDGTAFEAERDEVLIVLNRAASSAFAGLSELNQRHGGNAFTSSYKYLAGGGVVGRKGVTNITTSTTNNNAPVIDYDLLAQKIAESNKQLPHPVTLVQDIISETQSYNKIVEDANF